MATLRALEKWTDLLLPELRDEPLFRLEERQSSSPSPAHGDSLWTKIASCRDCDLHLNRAKPVQSRGSLESPLIVLGDYPSDQDEEAGFVFSGAPGDLLGKMLTAIKLDPSHVYCTTAWKCRTNPTQRSAQRLPDDCLKHLEEELNPSQARTIVVFGESAGQLLSGTELSLAKLRGQWHQWQGRAVLCTHHPRELIQFPERKKEAWSDLQKVAARLEAEK